MTGRAALRFYIAGQYEIFEWIAEEGEAPTRRIRLARGSALTDFLCLNFMEVFATLQQADSPSAVEAALGGLTGAHPCLLALRGAQAGAADYDTVIGALTEQIFSLEELQTKMRAFVDLCLTPGCAPEDAAGRYLRFSARHGAFPARQPRVDLGLAPLPENDSPSAWQDLQTQPEPRAVLAEIVYPASAAECMRYFALHFLRDGTRFKICKFCGLHFALLGSTNADYCTRPYGDTGKTCREIGAIRRYQSKKAEDPVSRLYTKAYKKYFAWIKYGKFTKEEFADWSRQARQKRDACLAGELSVDEFRAWLNVRTGE